MKPKMQQPVVVNLRAEKDWGQANDLYIGRGSLLGNPFRIGVHGPREVVIAKYRGRWELRSPADRTAILRRLTGKRLGCYCKPADCHGDVLVEAWKILAAENARLIRRDTGLHGAAIVDAAGWRIEPAAVTPC